MNELNSKNLGSLSEVVFFIDVDADSNSLVELLESKFINQEYEQPENKPSFMAIIFLPIKMEDWAFGTPLFQMLIYKFEIVIFLNKSESLNLEFCKTLIKSDFSFKEIVNHLSPFPDQHFYIPFSHGGKSIL